MELNINTKYNIDDIVYVVLRNWESEEERFLYYAHKKPAQIKRINISLESEYILSNKYGETKTIIEYYFKNFDENFLVCNSQNEKMCFANWEEANKHANKLNK